MWKRKAVIFRDIKIHKKRRQCICEIGYHAFQPLIAWERALQHLLILKSDLWLFWWRQTLSPTMALPLKEKAFSKSNLKTQNLEDDNCCIIYQSFVGILWSSPYLRSQSTERLKKAPMAEMRRNFFVETNTKEFWSRWNEKTHSLSFSKFGKTLDLFH